MPLFQPMIFPFLQFSPLSHYGGVSEQHCSAKLPAKVKPQHQEMSKLTDFK